MIGYAFADILRDVADAGPFLNRNFSAVKSHRVLRALALTAYVPP